MRPFSMVVLSSKVTIFVFLLFVGQAVYSESGFQSLRMGADARTEAMGMAGTALSTGAAAGFWNPAGLMIDSGRDALFSWHRWFQDVKSGAFGISSTGKGQAISLNLIYSEVGDIEHRVIPSLVPIGKFSWNEFAAGLSYARSWKTFSIGLTFKFLYEKIFIDEAWGVAADVGAIYEVRQNGLRIGFVLTNMGKTNKLRSETIELPFCIKLGLAEPFSFFGFDWIVALDGVLEKNEPFHVHGGVEWDLYKRLYIRTGYQSGYDNRSSTFGAGIVWKFCRLDYGFMPFGSGLGDSHRLTFGISW